MSVFAGVVGRTAKREACRKCGHETHAWRLSSDGHCARCLVWQATGTPGVVDNRDRCWTVTPQGQCPNPAHGGTLCCWEHLERGVERFKQAAADAQARAAALVGRGGMGPPPVRSRRAQDDEQGAVSA